MREIVRQAVDAAGRAAAAAEARLVELQALEDLDAVVALLDDVWGREVGHAVPRDLLVAMTHAGNQVTGAYRDARLVGATAALLGRHDDVLHLHSHITGVRTGVQGRGVGWALKQHQRAWALQRGITQVRWTFDPLVRRNAVFNLVKLGARPVAFLENCYGALEDELNRGLPTDRLLIVWELTQQRVRAASEGEFHTPDLDNLRRVGAREVLVEDDGRPRRDAPEGARLLIQIPADIESVRVQDRELAAEWATALRTTLGTALERGYRVTGITRDGWYVLAADRNVAELAGT